MSEWSSWEGDLLNGSAGDVDTRAEVRRLSSRDRHRILVEWNDSTREYPQRCFHQLFEELVDATPDAVAVVFGNAQLTYSELNRQANQFANCLQRLGVGPEQRVGIYVERGFEMLVAMLGVLKAGGAYVPLDPTYPAVRVAFMLEDAAVRVVVTQDSLAPRLPQHDAILLRVDGDQGVIAGEPESSPGVEVSPLNLAYVIYTSGSTGRPKGVMVTHSGVANLADVYRTDMALGEGARVLQFASTSFDASVSEIAMALCTGAALVLAEREVLSSGRDLLHLLQQQAINVVTLPPALLEVLPYTELPRLHTLLVAGDRCPPKVVDRWSPGRRFINAYGPTECTVCATWIDCEPGDGTPPPIGYRLPNVALYVLDEVLEPAPIGMPGELYIGGAGLARGYLHRPALTAERFVPNPFSEDPGQRIYRTGDFVRWLPNGTLEFLGRVDDQAKVRGYRIELGEVESALAEDADVESVAVIVRGDGSGEKQLIAYVVGASGVDIASVRARLASRLPEYMIPTTFALVASLPTTPNGKIDRNALRERKPCGDSSPIEAPRQTTEKLMAAMWASILGVDRVSRSDRFFELGGHSIAAIQLVMRVREELGVDLPLQFVLRSPTLSEAARLADTLGKTAGRDQGAPAMELRPDRKNAPVSLAQEGVWLYEQLNPGTRAYLACPVVWIHGPLRPPLLERALNEIAVRHESWRSSFHREGDQLVQRISDSIRIPLRLVDYSGASPDERNTMLREVALTYAVRPFDLTCAPLLRCALIRFSSDEHALVMVMHHMITDAWSEMLIIRHLAGAYGSLASEGVSQRPPRISDYGDFATWQRAAHRDSALAAARSYWRSVLADLPRRLAFPTGIASSLDGGEAETALRSELSGSQARSLYAFCQEHNVSASAVLYSALALVLKPKSDAGRLVLGVVQANRSEPQQEGMVGLFANTVPLVIDLSPNPPFPAVVCSVMGHLAESATYAHLPFELIAAEARASRTGGRLPLIQVLASTQLPREQVRAADLVFSSDDVDVAPPTVDLLVIFQEFENGVSVMWSWAPDRISSEYVRSLSQEFMTTFASATL